MAEFLTEFITDLASPPQLRTAPHQFAMGDNNAYTFTALVANTAEPEAALLAGTVSGTALRPDGTTVALEGVKGAAVRQVTLSGQTLNATPCSVTLPQACFAYPGRVLISIKLVDGTTATTVLALSGTVIRTETDAAVDPGEVIPDLAAIQAAASEAVEAAEDATSAAADARAAASSAVRYDTAQSLTDAQKNTAMGNIGAASEADKTAILDGSGHVDWGWVPGEQTATVAGVTVTRNGNRIKLNGVSTANFFVRMVGNLLAQTSSQTAAQVIAGCPTIAGHEYQYQMRLLSGSAALNTAHSSAFPLAPTPYKAGSTSAFTNHYAQCIEDEGWGLRDFTSDDGADLSAWLWCATGTTFTNAEYELTLLDVTAAEQTDHATTMARAALATKPGAIPVEAYGKPGSVMTNNKVRVSKGWGNRVRVDAIGNTSTYAMVSIQNGVNFLNNWNTSNDMVELDLEPFHTYKLTARYISGTVTQVGTSDSALVFMRKKESDSAPVAPSFTNNMIADINNSITEWHVIWTPDEPTKIGFGFYFRALTADALIIEFLCEDVTDSNDIAPADKSTAASTHTAGSLLTVNGTLYKATQAIAPGTVITPGTNVTPTTVAEQLAALEARIAALEG